MANLIQATVYQIDGSPLPAAATLDFQTSNLVIREATVAGFSAINSAILYYNVPNNQLSVQTFYVGEEIADLVAAANVGTTTQLQATVTEINEDPQVPGGVQYSFPANEILIGSNYIQFKATKYTVSELQSDLLVSGNGASAYKVYTALLTQSGGDNVIQIDQSEGSIVVGVTYNIDSSSNESDFISIGAPNNEVGTKFVATSTNITNWGGGALSYNTGAPVVTVLENTIGNIYWTYSGAGIYTGFLPNSITTEQKQAVFSIPQSASIASSSYYTVISNNTVDGEITIQTSNGTGYVDIGFVDFPIEIRVYN
jgi:hypothetical protein